MEDVVSAVTISETRYGGIKRRGALNMVHDQNYSYNFIGGTMLNYPLIVRVYDQDAVATDLNVKPTYCQLGCRIWNTIS